MEPNRTPEDGRVPENGSWRHLSNLAVSLLTSRGDPEVHPVAAAVEAGDGTFVTGLATYHFTGGICAELVALSTLRATTMSPPVLLCVVGDAERGLLTPCGRCRQVLADLTPGLRVAVEENGNVSLTAIEDLLPLAYKPRRRQVVLGPPSIASE